jgi:hypothetical protein
MYRFLEKQSISEFCAIMALARYDCHQKRILPEAPGDLAIFIHGRCPISGPPSNKTDIPECPSCVSAGGSENTLTAIPGFWEPWWAGGSIMATDLSSDKELMVLQEIRWKKCHRFL